MESAKAKENGGQSLNPSRHKHELYWVEGLPRYTCKGCKQFGANKGYKCTTCAKVLFHKVCADSPDEDIRNGVQLQFRRKTILSHSCHACGEFIKGFVFESSSRDVRLHPLCMVLPETFTYSGHKEHSLKLMRESGSGYSCSQCRQKYSGWRYRCAETTCRVIVDLNCCIIDIHDQNGTTKIASPSRRKRFLRKVGNGGKSMTGAAMRGTVEGFGVGLATAAVGGLAVDNIDDEEEEGEGEGEEEEEEEEEEEA